jgi:hypothetical protein
MISWRAKSSPPTRPPRSRTSSASEALAIAPGRCRAVPSGYETQGAIARLEFPERERRAPYGGSSLHADGLRTDFFSGLFTTGGSGSLNAAS